MNLNILKQEDLLERLEKAFTNYKKSPKDRITVSYIESRSECLEKWYNDFENTHCEIVCNVEKQKKSDLSYFSQDIYGAFEDTYIEYKTRMKDDLRKLTTVSSDVHFKPNSGASNAEVKLPKIELRKFSGSYEEWESFHDMFVSLVHTNASLSPVQKLHYLKASLYGEAELLLKNLSTTDTNYDEAWKQLTRRYTNKRFNCNEVMKRLFGQRSLTTETATGTKQLLDTTSACLKSLHNLKIDTSSWDAIINHLVLMKIDSETRKLWELQVSQTESEELPTWKQLSTFLETRFRTLEMLEGVKTGQKASQSNCNAKQTPNKRAFHSIVEEKTTAKNNEKVCAMCAGTHAIYQCKQFEKQSPEERSEFVQSKGLCFNCLSSNHSVRFCRQPMCCRKCGRRHHMMLHYERVRGEVSTVQENPKQEIEKTTGQNVQVNNKPQEKKVVAHYATERNECRVLLATALIRVRSSHGKSLIVRALIDQGSEASFVTEEITQVLGLKKSFVNGVVIGVGEEKTIPNGMISVELESLQDPNFSILVSAFVLKTVTSHIPTKEIVITDWPIFENLNLADPKYGSPSKIDMILGAEIYGLILTEGLIKHPSMSGIIAQNTQFGWILSGRVEQDSSLNSRRVVSLHVHLKEDVLLQKFWEIEREPDFIGKRMTKHELRCEEIFEETTIRESSGRYIVRLPFKSSNPECLEGKLKDIAMRLFKVLEKKLYKNPTLYEEYKKVMDDYVAQDHMELIEDQSQLDEAQVVYLPHHAVVREDKETTKLRVVYNASCKGINNVSLNDDLLVGPKLQPELRHILMRWRCHKFCIVADIKQMYRQVKVEKGDTDFQRILWRPKPNGPVQHYRLKRLTFGTACAPYLAVKSLQQLAKNESENYPVASQITLTDYYMDDLLTGCEDAVETIEIYEQMSSLMKAGGFELQKWSTNSKQLLDHIRDDNRSKDQSVIFKQNEMVKVLGIMWNKNTDNFEYDLHLPEKAETMTKRNVLSEIARLYDPLGWIAPVIIRAKIFIQQLWKSGLGWDDDVPTKLLKEWHSFRDDLANVQSLSIPRWLQTKREDEVELHTFADASQSGYAAAVYMKTKKKNGDIFVNLVTAKTKIAPVEKEISIPRMELCAALLATKLVFEVAQIMNMPKESLHAWSDSTVVLAWLAGEPSRWTTFVSNRVSEILTMLDREQWNHVSTLHNPADCASRGATVVELLQKDLWWHGPYWMRQDKYNRQCCGEFKTNEEVRPIKTFSVTICKEESIWARFSNLARMLRVISYCRRLLHLKLPERERPRLSEVVTVEEKEEVLKLSIKEVQKLYFEEEIKQLRLKGCVPPKSKLHTLNPLVDDNGIIRVGGRIQEADVEFDVKHPIILPNESHLTRLIVLDAHIKSLHGGPQLMLNILRRKFWIIRARELAKRCYRTCVKCVRYAKQNNNPLMGQLPEVRLKPIRPFKITGVDFTGHINVRFSPGRGSKSFKGYICVFICMFSKAVHLEAVSDLTSQGFIAAFRRFTSRRGHCQTLYSDNGCNFIGASKELRDMFNKSTSQIPEEISKLLSNDGTTWSFIPPHAPNFGGIWEAGVRSTKAHLKRVIGDSTLTFEELSTVLTQIEACLNSRPLSYLSNSPDDPMPLTPGHFLIGEPLIILPDENYDNLHVTSLQRWKYTQKIVNDFWKKWSDEYLVTLHQRHKWALRGAEPDINDVVIIRDHNLPPAKWLLGRIVEKHTGKDNVTRVLTIKTKNGLCKRPFNKLCLLPKSNEDDKNL